LKIQNYERTMAVAFAQNNLLKVAHLWGC